VKGQLKLPLQETVLQAKAQSVIHEYFAAGDLDEALRRLEELQAGRGGHVVVKALVVSAAERKSRECEMASVLLSAMTKLYGSEHFFEGFIRMLRSVDTPSSKQQQTVFTTIMMIIQLINIIYILSTLYTHKLALIPCGIKAGILRRG
jgi:hypothetical protein